MKIGDSVTYVDARGIPHAALVTQVWTPTGVNVIFVDDDEKKTDDYGRQIRRETSVVHKSLQPAHGNYFE